MATFDKKDETYNTPCLRKNVQTLKRYS